MCLGIAIIVFMVSYNEAPEESNLKNVTLKETFNMILEGFTSNAVLVDFFQREGIIVIIVSSMLFLTRRYNAYLDEVEKRLDQEEYEALKKAKLMKKTKKDSGLDKVNEEDEDKTSSSEEDDGIDMNKED